MRRLMSLFMVIAAAGCLASCHGYVDPEVGNDGVDGPDDKVDTSVVLNSGYARKMIAMQFTSVGCVNCPYLSSALKDVTAVRPNVIPVAFHMDYNGQDPMTLPVNAKFFEKVNTGDGTALPLFALNFRKSSQHIINEYSKIESEIDLQAKLHPAVCGVAVESSWQESSRSLEIKAKFNADVAGEYRYHIFLLEDGLDYAQAGSDEKTYIHDNVLRMMCGDNVVGSKINDGKPLEPGKEYEVVKTVTLQDDWKAENMRIVVAMLNTEDGGETFCCNNANECALGGSAGYAYVGSLFQRHVCVMEFTGTWCAQCPDGAVTLNYLVGKQYVGKAFALAFHNNDEYALPQEQELYGMFKWDGYPAFVTDLRDVGLLNEGGCKQSIEKSLYETKTFCGVALKSSYDAHSGFASIQANVVSEVAAGYRMAAFVIEDKVVGEQKESTGSVNPDYTHRHMVRAMLSSAVLGDELGEISAGAQAVRTYTFKVDEAWNLENLYVAVLAIDQNGHVNNMAQCLVDGGRMNNELLN